MDARLDAELGADLRTRAAGTALPEPGWAWNDPEAAWWRVVGQICAVGSARSWEALARDEVREILSVGRIQDLGCEAPAEVHRVLAAVGVRYCSRDREASTKALAIVRNARASYVCNREGEVVILEHLCEEVGPPDTRGCWPAEQARAARRALVREVAFIGPKSASDFLLGLGLAEDLVALDVRILNLLVDGLGWVSTTRQVGNLRAYEQVEAGVLEMLAQPNGLNGLALDRTMFHHYGELMPLWKGRAKPDAASPQ